LSIGTLLKKEIYIAKVRKSLGDKVSFDTLDKGKIDSLRTREYYKVLEKSPRI
jgi:hypothetical protein